MKHSLFQQVFPIALTVLTFFALSILLYYFIAILNLLPLPGKITQQVRPADLAIGLTIYLKTSIDFAIFIGNLMAKNPGVKNRIAIEIGTALGNAAGTFFVLVVWTFFKEVPLLLILMILLAALVLLGMAEEGLEELPISTFNFPILKTTIPCLKKTLHTINALFSPVTRFILPHGSTDSNVKRSFLTLLVFAFTVPLILGLDDFAGYIPLFTIINVFGFSVGVFLGHMLLNIALFASPTITVNVVKQPLIILIGSLAFIGIALWGLWEVYSIGVSLLIH